MISPSELIELIVISFLAYALTKIILHAYYEYRKNKNYIHQIKREILEIEKSDELTDDQKVLVWKLKMLLRGLGETF